MHYLLSLSSCWPSVPAEACETNRDYGLGGEVNIGYSLLWTVKVKKVPLVFGPLMSLRSLA